MYINFQGQLTYQLNKNILLNVEMAHWTAQWIMRCNRHYSCYCSWILHSIELEH